MANAPFPIQPTLTAIAVRYRNSRLIADGVMPRVPVGTQEFKYLRHTMAEGFTIPDTRVGRRSRPNEVEFTAVELPAACQDYGLDDVIPQRDINNAPENYDPVARAVEGLTDLLLLDREKRVADIVFDLNTYPATQRQTLSGTSQWSDYTNSTPLVNITTALDAMVMRANIMVIGRQAWTRLSMHPQIVKAVMGYANDAGIVTREQVAALFELEEVLVGEGWLNTARKGQTANMQRVWGKHCALLHRDSQAGPQMRTTFGFTGQFGGRVSGQMAEPHAGILGGTRVRVGESVAEVVSANDLGYFFQNAVA
jgi:hypothetical protein